MFGAGRGLPCQHEGQTPLSAQGMLAASTWNRMVFTCQSCPGAAGHTCGRAGGRASHHSSIWVGQVCLQDSGPDSEIGKLLGSTRPLRQPEVLRGRAGRRDVDEASPGQRGSLLTPPLGLSHNSLLHQKRPCTGPLWSWPAGHFLSWFLGMQHVPSRMIQRWQTDHKRPSKTPSHRRARHTLRPGRLTERLVMLVSPGGGDEVLCALPTGSSDQTPAATRLPPGNQRVGVRTERSPRGVSNHAMSGAVGRARTKHLPSQFPVLSGILTVSLRRPGFQNDLQLPQPRGARLPGSAPAREPSWGVWAEGRRGLTRSRLPAEDTEPCDSRRPRPPLVCGGSGWETQQLRITQPCLSHSTQKPTSWSQRPPHSLRLSRCRQRTEGRTNRPSEVQEPPQLQR